MREIQIKSTLKNSENEITNVQTKGIYNIEENVICYDDHDLKVSVYIENERIRMLRKNDDYNLNLEFELNKKIKSKYEVKSIGLYIDLIIETQKLNINEKNISIKYELYNDESIIGSFEYDLVWE